MWTPSDAAQMVRSPASADKKVLQSVLHLLSLFCIKLPIFFFFIFYFQAFLIEIEKEPCIVSLLLHSLLHSHSRYGQENFTVSCFQAKQNVLELQLHQSEMPS